MTMTAIRFLATAATVLVAGIAPLAAKTCAPEPVTAKSSSRIAGDDAAREARAKDNAIKRWSKEAQAKVGITYKLWMTAEDKKFECGHTAKTAHCTVTAKPCRPF